MNTKVNICNVELKNPIIMASGTFGFGREYSKLYDLSELGGICTKGVTKERREGNDSPRIAETNMGMLNSVGLQNPGVDDFIKNEGEFLSSQSTVKIVNIAGNTIEDYSYVAQRVNNEWFVDMVELNISCPNVKQGGIAFGVDPKSVENITREIKKYVYKPLIVKLSPNVSNIADNARAAENGGADAISLINTLGGLAINYKTRKPVLANVYGGLSGPCVKPVALKMVHECFKAVKIPIIGMGGISNAADILEFMIAGARAIQVGTANFSMPNIGATLCNELTILMKSCKITDINEIVGSLSY